MSVGVASPIPILQFFGNNGAPLAGGSVLTQVGGINTATYQDVGLTVPLPNPIPLNSRGEISSAAGASQQLFLTPNVVYVFTFSDASGNPLWTANYVNGVQVDFSQNGIGIKLFPLTSGESNNSITPSNFGYPAGDLRRYGAAGDGVTDDTAAIQQALTANASFAKVFVPATGTFYKVTARLTAPGSTHLSLEDGSEIRWTATTANGTNFLGTASRPGIEALGDNFLVEGKGKLTGPQSAAAGSGAGGGGVGAVVTNEFGLMRVGTSATARGTGFVVRDVEISLWGQAGIATQFMQDLYINGCSIHDVGYAGIEHLSAQNSRVYSNKVYGIAPGISSNAYGITHTHDSTNYSSDPNASTNPRQVVNPFCIDVDVAFNEVRDVPLWNGIDFHGGYECRARQNAVYNCHRGIQLASGSGAAANYAGEDNHVIDNAIYGSQINGAATTDVSGFQAGIVVNGGSTLLHRGIVVRGNHLNNVGHASVTPTVYVLEASLCSGVVIQGNTFHYCLGRMVYMNNTVGVINGNFLDSLGSSAVGSNFLYIDSNCGPLSISGNTHSPTSGTTIACTNGLNTPGSGYTRMTISGNDLAACTNAYVNITGTYTRGNSDIIPQITDATTGSHTIDVSVFGTCPKAIISATQGSTATLTSLLNPQNNGQEVRIEMSGASTLTVNNAGNIKLQGGSRALTSASVLTLVWDSVGVKWQEVSCTLGNT